MSSEQTIADLLQERMNKTPHATAYHAMLHGEWAPVTWEEHGRKVHQLAHGLRSVGLKKGSRVAIMAKTSLEWECVQMAIMMNSGVVVGIDAHDTPENIGHIARTSGITGLVVENPTLLDKFAPEILEGLAFATTMDSETTNVKSLQPLQELFKHDAPSLFPDKPKPDSPATIIFTSGTTGQPKGIQYTHAQMVLASRAIVKAFPGIRQGWRMACWLPLSNLFQRMLNLCAMQVGAETFIVGNPREIMKLLPSINPHVFIGVPRFYEKLYEGMVQKISEHGTVAQAAFQAAMLVGDLQARSVRNGTTPNLTVRWLKNVCDRLVLSRLRAALGSNLQFMISGSAPMPLWLLEKFHAMGLLILEAYGISENIVPVSLNRPDAYRFGSVGRPLPENQLQIGDDGEVLVTGPGVCLRYYGHDQQGGIYEDAGQTRECLATGDLGRLDSDGFLFLTGRKSEIFKTSTGRRIAPARIEECLRQSQYVDQAMVAGQGRKFVVAVVSLAEEAIKHLTSAKSSDPAQTSTMPGLRDIIEDISKYTSELPAYQQPAGFVFTKRPFSVASGEITANLKLKRANISSKYAQALEKLYNDAEGAKGVGMQAHKFTEDIWLVTL